MRKKVIKKLECIKCGKKWHVSKLCKATEDNYKCPVCTGKRIAKLAAVVFFLLISIKPISTSANDSVYISGEIFLGGMSKVMNAFYDSNPNASEVIKELIAETEPVGNHISEEEYKTLCRIVEAEATDGSVEQKQNVASCVLNRVESAEWPDSIEDVVFQKGQFSPISDGRYYSVTISDTTREAVSDVLAEGCTHECIFFCTPTCSSARTGWFSKLKVEFTDGMHNYYTGTKK